MQDRLQQACWRSRGIAHRRCWGREEERRGLLSRTIAFSGSARAGLKKGYKGLKNFWVVSPHNRLLETTIGVETKLVAGFLRLAVLSSCQGCVWPKSRRFVTLGLHC